MMVAAINGVEEHSRHIGQIYQENYARLRHYFQAQLRDAAEADACVHETIRRFFFFMEDRCWEEDDEYVPVYLMRIAGGLLCSKKLAAETLRRRSWLRGDKAGDLFCKIRNEVFRPAKERLESVQLFLRAWVGRKPQWRHVPSLRRAPAVSV
jgi:DNA-directed RNA polymerase specialized sigma24 family protein